MRNAFIKALVVIGITVAAPLIYAVDVSADTASPHVIMADTSDDGSNIPLELAPIVVPTVVVGGMVLKSRTKRPSKGDVRYITNLEFTEDEDIPIGESSTTEPKNSSVKRESQKRTDDSDLISSGKNILAAIKESTVKGGGSNGQ